MISEVFEFPVLFVFELLSPELSSVELSLPELSLLMVSFCSVSFVMDEMSESAVSFPHEMIIRVNKIIRRRLIVLIFRN